MQLWAPDLVGWVGPDSVVTYAQEAQMAAHPKLSDTAYSLVKINEVTVEGSVAVVRDTWSRRITQADGHKALFRVRRFEIWRRQPDMQWKISRYIEKPASTYVGSAGTDWRSGCDRCRSRVGIGIHSMKLAAATCLMQFPAQTSATA